MLVNAFSIDVSTEAKPSIVLADIVTASFRQYNCIVPTHDLDFTDCIRVSELKTDQPSDSRQIVACHLRVIMYGNNQKTQKKDHPVSPMLM